MRPGALLSLALFATSAQAAPPPRFPPGAVWHTDISAAPLHPGSAGMLTSLQTLGGWGNGNRFQIDFGLHVRQVAQGEVVPRVAVVGHKGYGDYYSPDCEVPGTLMPLPADAAFEAQAGLTCDHYCDDDGQCEDCHLLVREGNLLYEVYNGTFRDGEIDALCLATWDLSVVYPPEGRGDHCTSADAAGFPIAPLLVNADEVAARMGIPGADLGHAIRFILPNPRMATMPDGPDPDGAPEPVYVRPASHAGGPSGPSTTVPYGVRLRLRADFDLTGYDAAAQVILRTMQRYGIVLSDGGNIALTFESDRFTTAKWPDLGIGPHVFWNGAPGNRTPVQVAHFDVVDTGARIEETYECVRSAVVPGNTVFADGFE